jgi:hypothetical protein
MQHFCENVADIADTQLVMPNQQQHWVRMQKMQEN